MKKLIPFILSLLAMTIIVGCSRSYADKQLEIADNIMLDNPDSAYQIIISIDTNKLISQKSKALYYLLLTQARYRVYIAQTDDSLISKAVRYFDDSKDLRHKMLARLYSGIIHYEIKDYPSSIIDLLNAEKAAVKLDDKFYLGMIYRSMSDVYHSIYNGTEDLKYARLAYDNFKMAKKDNFANYELIDIGTTYNSNKSYDKALALADSTLKIAKDTKDTLLAVESLRTSIIALISLNRSDSALSISHKLFSYPKDYLLADDSINLSIIYAYTGNYDKISDSIWSNNSDNERISHWLKYKYYYNINPKKALTELELYTTVLDSEVKAVINQNTISSAHNFYTKELELRDTTIQQKQIIIVLGIIFICCCCIILLIIRHNYKRNQASRISQILEFATNTSDAFDADSESSNYLNKLFEEKHKLLNTWCNTYYKLKGKEQSDVYSKIESTISTIISQIDINDITVLVNKLYDNVLDKLKSDITGLSNIDLTIFTYLAAGCTTSTICVLMNKSAEFIYNHRHRLRAKIATSDSPNKATYEKIIR
jgi:hypothetical protein